MATVNLPNTSKTSADANNFSDVYANDTAITAQVNGGLDSSNLASSAVTSAKITDGAVTDAKVASNAAVQGSKLDTGSGRLVQTTGLVVATGDLALTGSYQDIPGATVTFTPAVACYALVYAVFGMEPLTTGTNVTPEEIECQGTVTVDGSAQTRTAMAFLYQNTTTITIASYVTASQVYRIPLTAAAHTIKLQAKYSNLANSAAGTVFAESTNFMYQLVAQ